MPITKGDHVELVYELRDADGGLIESSNDEDSGPILYVHLDGELPPRVEQALDGKEEGDVVIVDLEPGEAFGPYDPEGLVSVPREDLPEDAEIVPGDWIAVAVEPEEGDEDGEGTAEELEARVVEVNPDGVVLDLNHPLAQEAVQFRLTVGTIGVEA